MMKQSHSIYEFTPFRLDLREGSLLRSGKEIKLRPIVFKLLVVLVDHHGQVLDDDRLMDLVWGKVVEENVLVVSIGELRRKLGCEGLIERVARRGYRFAAKVTLVVNEILPEEIEPPPPEGALSVNSSFYLERQTDEAFYRAIVRYDSIVLVKGARQVGKTSLLARGLQKARASGAMVALTDLQHLSKDAFVSAETLLKALGERIAEQLQLRTRPHDVWSNLVTVSTNFERFLQREVLEKLSAPLVWGLDEVDKLFGCDYAGDIFGLFRSWHNLRALEPSGPWRRMTILMAYATEAHLFITDLNQSPFNVGTRLSLKDFTLEQITDLNQRYDSPLKDESERARFFDLLGGHPYLAHRGLYEMAQHGIDFATFDTSADHDEGVFGDHLRRMLKSLQANTTFRDAVRSVLEGKPQLGLADFYHLRSAGVLVGDSAQDARLRCQLYARFLAKRLL
jgi:DNA-binding winged helix-turn-helix (wHTH) protein